MANSASVDADQLGLSPKEATRLLKSIIDENGADQKIPVNLMSHWVLARSDAISTRQEASVLIEEYGEIEERNDGQDMVVGLTLADQFDFDGDDKEVTLPDLTALEQVGPALATELENHGFSTIANVNSASVEDLVEVEGINVALAETIKKSASTFLDPITATAAACRERERGGSCIIIVATHDDDTLVAGEPTTENFYGLPVLDSPRDEYDDVFDHPFIERLDFDYYEQPAVIAEPTPDKPDNVVKLDVSNIEVISKRLADGRNVLLEGPAGCGKNVGIKYISDETNRPAIRVNFGSEITYEDLVGHYEVQADGSMEFIPGFLTIAVRIGAIFVADEINAAPPEATMPLNSVTEAKPLLQIRETSQIIKPHPAFRFVGTLNPATGPYGGAKKLNAAFESRFTKIKMDYLPEKKEAALIDELVNRTRQVIHLDDITTHVKIANTIRRRIKNNENYPLVSTRDLIDAAELTDLMDSKEAIKFVVDSKKGPEHQHIGEGLSQVYEMYYT